MCTGNAGRADHLNGTNKEQRTQKGHEIMAEKDNLPQPVHQRFMALQRAEQTADVVKRTFGNKGISVFDLERIKIPAGGGVAWQVVDSTGDMDSMKSITCAIPYMRNDRSYWAQDFQMSGGGSPPSCVSLDLINQAVEQGVGDNGDGPGTHACRTCKQNQWGSHPLGTGGRACRETWLIFLLREGREKHLFPSLLVVTPGSLKGWTRYNTGLVSQGLYYASVLHRLELQPAKSKGGIAYAEIKPSMVRELTEEEMGHMRRYEDAVRSAFGGVRVEADDVVAVAD